MVEFIKITTKCAEIRCDVAVEPKFTITCICGLSGLDFDAFRLHFCSKHLHKAHEQKAATETVAADCLQESLLMLPTDIQEAPTIRQTDALTADADENDSRKQSIDCRPRNKSNTCTYCGRTFRRRYLLDTHLNIHTGRKPHQCEMCGKQFRAVSTLRRHQRTHEQREALQCQHCDKHFTHRSALLSHELRHTQVRRFACSSCDKCFYTPNQRDTHRRKLHSAQRFDADRDAITAHPLPLPFACELCGNSYRSASTLSTHKLKKHYRQAKHSCEQCGKKFVDADRLHQHQLIHVKPELILK
ncbi:zinc finger protein 41 [Drosophila grimshawi]|uniref:GH24096 n=1 Tax=Drosophila grimshawi TaxID=7222 RepID=B4JNQ4_DROGR|nr:zinc finger protein 41 [Drosophila grimshawi]EDV92347.1 GH24096 [Drosophila grimshawi]